MKALTLTAIKSPLILQDRPDLQPQPDQVVVALKAAALNRRDYWITQGLYPKIQPPVTLGSDGSGVVAKVGREVNDAWIGREVILDPGIDWGDNPAVQSDAFTILGLPRDGTFASQVVVQASQLHDKPPHLNWHQAAALPLAGVTAWRALFRQGQFQSGQSVLITGIGGGVAVFALQFAVAAGADVWVTSSSHEKIQRAIQLGAQGGFDYTDSSWPQQLLSQTNAPDLIIDSAGGKGYRELIQIAAPGGTVVNYGATAGPPDKLDLFKVFWKQLRLQGSTMGSPDDFTAMVEWVNDQKIVPVVDSVMPLAAGDRALQQMNTSPQFGKYVLQIAD